MAPGAANQVWYEAFGTAGAPDLPRRLEALTRNGLTPAARPGGPAPGPGIIFFDAITPELTLISSAAHATMAAGSFSCPRVQI